MAIIKYKLLVYEEDLPINSYEERKKEHVSHGSFGFGNERADASEGTGAGSHPVFGGGQNMDGVQL